MANFNIFPLRESARTAIKRPRHILEFSFDEEHICHPLSDRSLRYYYPPFFEPPWVEPPPVRLSSGRDKWIKVDESVDYHLDGLLKTIQKHEEILLEKGTPLEEVRVRAEVVAWRGILTKVMQSPYDPFVEFEFNATCFQDTIYLELNHSFHTESNQQQKQQQDRRPPQQDGKGGWAGSDVMQYWGYKFETLSTIPRPWGEMTSAEIESRDEEVVNNNVQYCSIVRTGIGTTSLILAGEVDCIMYKPDEMDVDIPWVELKTTGYEPEHTAKEQRKWETKMMRFWAQSFLLGVPTVVVGFRTKNGLLTTLRTLEVQKLPRQVKQMDRTWDGNVCVNTVAAFLEFVKESIMGREGVWRIKMRKSGREEKSIELFQVEPTGTGRIIEPGFKEHRERLLAMELAQKDGEGT